MTLGFMQSWPKGMAMKDDRTYFIEKINLGLWNQGLIKRIEYIDSLEEYRSKFGDNWDWKPRLHPKLHTIRIDQNDRWRPEMDIHFVINGRTKDRFQFAPVVKCVSVQEIEFYWWKPEHPELYPNPYDDKLGDRYCDLYVDNRVLNIEEVESLALNDGFETVEDFFRYFNEDFKGKLIHWTNLKY